MDKKGRITAAIIGGIFLVLGALIAFYSSDFQLNKIINATLTAETLATQSSITPTPATSADANPITTIDFENDYGVQFGTDVSYSSASGNFGYFYINELDPLIVKVRVQGKFYFVTYAINLSEKEAKIVKNLFEEDYPNYGNRNIVLMNEIIFGCSIVEDPGTTELKYIDCSE